MKPKLYGTPNACDQKLRETGYQDVRLIDATEEGFTSPSAGCREDTGIYAGIFPVACRQEGAR